MQITEHKTFAHPDETREFPKGHAEILKIGGAGSMGVRRIDRELTPRRRTRPAVPATWLVSRT